MDAAKMKRVRECSWCWYPDPAGHLHQTEEDGKKIQLCDFCFNGPHVPTLVRVPYTDSQPKPLIADLARLARLVLWSANHILKQLKNEEERSDG